MQLINTHDADPWTKTGTCTSFAPKPPSCLRPVSKLQPSLAGSIRPQIEAACATYGQALGTAFQIIDDVLDYDGDAAGNGQKPGR